MIRLCLSLFLLVASVTAISNWKQDIRDFVHNINQKSLSSKDILDHAYVKNGRVSLFVKDGRKGGDQQVMIEVQDNFPTSYDDLVAEGCHIIEEYKNAQSFIGICPANVVTKYDFFVPPKHEPSLYESVEYFFGVAPDNFSTQGEGVIVAVVDTGVDVSHKDFLDYEGKSRVTKYWVTNVDESTNMMGTGEEICAQISCDEDGHGTHVASTAAGRFGVAPKAEIWAAQIDLSYTSISTAVFSMVEMAQSMGKPIVINLSLGSDWYSHTGRDQRSEMLNLVVRDKSGALMPGVAVAIAAGNSGDRNLHYKLDVGAGDSQSFEVKMWGSGAEGQAGDVLFSVPAGANLVFSAQTSSTTVPYELTTSSTSGWHFDLDGQHAVSSIIIADADLPADQSEGTVTVTITNNGDAATVVHAWGVRREGWVEGSTSGDNESTLGDLCAPDIAICVGSVTSKSSTGDVVDERSPFSSQGPRVFTPPAQAIKPNIAAPGHGIIAAYSQSIVGGTTSDFPGVTDASYQSMSGTSMATPHVAGGIALLLQVDPSLTQEGLQMALQNNAGISSTPNNELGYGSVILADTLIAVGYAEVDDVCDSASVPAGDVATLGFNVPTGSLCVEHLLPAVTN